MKVSPPTPGGWNTVTVLRSPLTEPLIVVVNGPPGSGKTTLAKALVPRLGLPLVSKDEIKEALMGTWEVNDVETSRRLGRAAIAAMFAVARSSPIGVVLEANFTRELSRTELSELGAPIVEIFSRCPRELCLTRYRERSSARDPGHLDSQRSDSELWNEETANPVAGGWPVIEVGTSGPVDVEIVLAALRSMVAGAG
jgi:predicted kinase